MIIVLRPNATEKQINHIVDRVKKLGLKPMISKGVERTIIGVIGEEDVLRVQPLEVFPGVEKVMPVLAPYKLVSIDFKPEKTIVDVAGVKIGGKKRFTSILLSIQFRRFLKLPRQSKKQVLLY